MSDRVPLFQARSRATNISIFDSSARLIGIVDLEISPDIANLQQRFERVLAACGIRVSHVRAPITLSGMAADAVAADRAVSVALGVCGDVVSDAGGAPAGAAGFGSSKPRDAGRQLVSICSVLAEVRWESIPETGRHFRHASDQVSR
jgi:Flp pilus assembly secretin CpaC